MTTSNDNTNDHIRMLEALLFAANEPLSIDEMVSRLPECAKVNDHIDTLRKIYSSRGVNLVERGGKWLFQTASDLSFLLLKEVEAQRKLSRAGVETLAIIAYHQPVTRAEIEEIRGVTASKGTIDVLMEAGWVKLKGRRRTPGKPTTYGTSDDFLVHFGLEGIDDLPGIEELKAAGLLDSVDTALVKMEQKLDLGKKSVDKEDDQFDIKGVIRESEVNEADINEPLKPLESNVETDDKFKYKEEEF